MKWPGNSLDLKPFKNSWNQIKVAFKNKDAAAVPRLKPELAKLWVSMDTDYFLMIADPMPKRIRKVMAVKRKTTKY